MSACDPCARRGARVGARCLLDLATTSRRGLGDDARLNVGVGVGPQRTHADAAYVAYAHAVGTPTSSEPRLPRSKATCGRRLCSPCPCCKHTRCMFTHVLGTGACSQERDTCTGTAIPCVPSALTHDDALSLAKPPFTLCSLCIQTLRQPGAHAWSVLRDATRAHTHSLWTTVRAPQSPHRMDHHHSSHHHLKAARVRQCARQHRLVSALISAARTEPQQPPRRGLALHRRHLSTRRGRRRTPRRRGGSSSGTRHTHTGVAGALQGSPNLPGQVQVVGRVRFERG